MRTVMNKGKPRILEEAQAARVMYATLPELWATWNRKDIHPNFKVASSGCSDYGFVLIFVFAKFCVCNKIFYNKHFFYFVIRKKISIVGKDHNHFTGMVRLERSVFHLNW